MATINGAQVLGVADQLGSLEPGKLADIAVFDMRKQHVGSLQRPLSAFFGAGKGTTASAYSRLWIGDRVPRKIDALSLMSMSDAFFGRVFHARNELVPLGTVSLTTYFHTSTEDLAAEDITRVLAVADAKIFHRSYGDQNGELWSPNGRLLATTTQITYFKA